jgi:LuxR family maltose regulon positive regulatory protein
VQGSFTARKERSGRAGWYWKAYRKHKGTLHRAYLGKSADLTLERLNAIARELAGRAAELPRESPTAVGPDQPSNVPPLRSLDQPPEAAPIQPFSLLLTKLYIPPPRPHLVARARLVERVQAGLAGKFTLIVAPAGFGKTTLVSAWIAARAESKGLRTAGVTASLSPRVAWVSLDAGDNDATRFWSYVIAALETIYPAVGAITLALLRSPQPPATEVVLTPLLNAISALPIDAALILDDYHLIDTPAIHTAMTFLLDHLPPHLHVIMITRADPSLPLTRLRTRGELVEVRAADLRFTTDEAAAFLSAIVGVPLSADEVAALGQRTEGWIAGLQFAALAMRDRSDRASFIEAFTGSNRFVVDYLAEEVLARQPPHLLAFLLQTSILDRMCGPLCDTVLGVTNDQRPTTNDQEINDSSFVARRSSFVDSYSQLILEQLERANVFLIALDDNRQWYRYHHLFADVLRGRLASGASGVAIATLHSRASAWFEQQGLEIEAVEHALATGDGERAARLIEQCAWPVAFRGQIHTVLGWFDVLPAALILARPTLCTLHALMLMHTDQLDAAETRLQEAERGLSPDTPEQQARAVRGLILTTQANISFFRGDLPRCVALGRQALDLLPETNSLPRAASMAFAAHAFLVTGDATTATERQVAAVAPAARAAGNRFVVLRGLTLLAQLQVLQGRLHAAAVTYREAAQLAPEPGGLQSMVGSAGYYFGLGNLCRERNDLAAAEQLLVEGIDRALGVLTANATYFEQGFIALARLQYARGDRTAARATLGRFADLGRQRTFDPLVLARGVAAQAQLALAQGNLDEAVRWADTSGLHADDDLSFPHEMEYLILARVLIAKGRSDPAGPFLREALSLLDRLRAAAEADGRMGSAIEILIVQALALDTQQDLTKALAALERALSLAEPEGYVRVFVDEGDSIAALLMRVAERRTPVAPYAVSLLDAFPRTKGQGLRTETAESTRSVLRSQSSVLVEPLTEREIEILQLIAAGRSNQAIADTLVIAVSTVKKHINNLYGKLEARSRTQALLRARELNLL